MLKVKARMQADGIEVIGPTDHTIFKSIYATPPATAWSWRPILPRRRWTRRWTM
jgi:hypothetical protein